MERLKNTLVDGKLFIIHRLEDPQTQKKTSQLSEDEVGNFCFKE